MFPISDSDLFFHWNEKHENRENIFFPESSPWERVSLTSLRNGKKNWIIECKLTKKKKNDRKIDLFFAVPSSTVYNLHEPIRSRSKKCKFCFPCFMCFFAVCQGKRYLSKYQESLNDERRIYIRNPIPIIESMGSRNDLVIVACNTFINNIKKEF